MVADYTNPSVNLKCIVFTALLASGYWYLPPKNKFVLVSLAYFPYLAIAWYDWIYGCKHNFGPTYLAHFYAWGKPQNSSQIQIYKNWAPSIKRRVQIVDLGVAVIILLLLPKFLNWQPKKELTEEERKKSEHFSILLLIITIGTLGWLRYYK